MKDRRATLWFIFLFAIELLAAGLVTSKIAILEVIIAVLVGRTLAVRKVSTAVKGFAVLGLLLFVLQPVVTGYRMMGRSTAKGYASSAMETGSLMMKSLSDFLHGCNVGQEAYIQDWWYRLCYTPQQAFAVHMYDSGMPGSPWRDFAMGLIPRLLWPNKPLVTPGVNFSLLISNNPDNNNAPGILAEGYWYGGWLGVVVVCFYAGMFLGGIDRVSNEVISCRAWIAMPLIIVGIRTGFRIDGWFSTEYMFGSVWYILLAAGIFYFSMFYLIWDQRNVRLPFH